MDCIATNMNGVNMVISVKYNVGGWLKRTFGSYGIR